MLIVCRLYLSYFIVFVFLFIVFFVLFCLFYFYFCILFIVFFSLLLLGSRPIFGYPNWPKTGPTAASNCSSQRRPRPATPQRPSLRPGLLLARPSSLAPSLFCFFLSRAEKEPRPPTPLLFLFHSCRRPSRFSPRMHAPNRSMQPHAWSLFPMQQWKHGQEPSLPHDPNNIWLTPSLPYGLVTPTTAVFIGSTAISEDKSCPCTWRASQHATAL